MKINLSKRILLIGILLVSLLSAEKSGANANEKEKMNKIQSKSNNQFSQNFQDVSYNRPSESYTHSSEYVMPHLTRSPQYELQSRTVIPLTNVPVGLVAHQVNEVVSCPCAANIPVIQCRPCGSLPLHEPEPIVPVYDCPCAPKPNCPVCPPLSLLHDIASKKVNIL